MSTLLELKEVLQKFYAKNEVFITPLVKFLLAMISLLMINANIGHMDKINNIAIVLVVALMCSFLPSGFMPVFGALFILLHVYDMSLEAAIVVLAVFLIMLLLYFSFSPKDAMLVMLLPMCFVLKIPYIIPIAAGLLCAPASAAAVACGTVAYYVVSIVKNCDLTANVEEGANATAKIRVVIDGLLGNKAMVVTIVAFVITVIVVYMIRRLSADHSWTLAIIAGSLADIVILLLGDAVFNTSISPLGVILGGIVCALLAYIIQFFAMNLDYARTEKVQFEDDEYYYYVKAVPKVTSSYESRGGRRKGTKRYANRRTPVNYEQEYYEDPYEGDYVEEYDPKYDE